MEQRAKNAKMGTPTKCPQAVQPNASESFKSYENSNPNVKSGKLQRSASRKPNPVFASSRIRIRERKFVVAKKKKNNDKIGVKDGAVDPDCKCRDKTDGKCLCLAYENLRVSQEEFFKSWKGEVAIEEVGAEDCENESKTVSESPKKGQGCGKDGSESESMVVNEAVNCEPEQAESPNGTVGSSSIKRRRDKLMEEARQSVPEAGSGRVLHLVQAFEKLLTIPKNSEKKDEKQQDEDVKKGIKMALSRLQGPKAPETLESTSCFSPEDLVLTAESLGLGSQVSSSSDSSQGSSRRSSTGSVGSRRSGSASSINVGRRKLEKKQLKVTSQKPFKLRTEERGKEKEEEFLKKLQEMMIQEEKQRIPIAQGLPWTTDEPEIMIKPLLKESTRPLDIKMHTDVRAEERAEFDYQVAEKLNLIEQYRMERERQQKLAEEEEIKRLRKELVLKAQPMPNFDRPFIPSRSMKQATIPREPKFHLPHHKKMKVLHDLE